MTDENGSAEQRLAAMGVPIEEQDFDGAVDPEVSGCILAEFVPGGVRLKAVVQAGLGGWQRDMFAEWAESRFVRLQEHGTEPDGWQERSDGAWQLWGRMTPMPEDPDHPGSLT
jgi:hypothetical protein